MHLNVPEMYWIIKLAVVTNFVSLSRLCCGLEMLHLVLSLYPNQDGL